jgi:hypothetical protein
MFINIKMNKKQKKKLRKDTLKLLETQRGKLNNLTYLSLKNKIEDKRIDAVKRINERLKDIRTSTKTGIVQKDIKMIGQEIKSQSAKKIQKLAYKGASFVPKINQFNKTGKSISIKQLKI